MWTDFQNSFSNWFIRKFCVYTSQSWPAICCYTTLVKFGNPKCYWFWQHPQQTVDMCLRTHWGLDLTFNSSQTAQTVWLTNILKIVRQSLESTVECCCIMVIFSPCWSLHNLCSLLAVLGMLYTYLSIKSLVQYFCGRLRKMIISH